MLIQFLRPALMAVLVSPFIYTLAQAEKSAPSAFRDYKQFDEPGLSDWKASNDKVRTIGGWRTYLKEAQVEAQVDSPVGTPAQAATQADSQINTQGSPASAVLPSAHSQHHHQHGGEK